MEGFKLNITKDNDISVSLSDCSSADLEKVLNFIKIAKGYCTNIYDSEAYKTFSVPCENISNDINAGELDGSVLTKEKIAINIKDDSNTNDDKQVLDSLDRVRDRLPNEYDLKELELKQADYSETFMCPVCGQHTIALAKDGVLMKLSASSLRIYDDITIEEKTIEEYDKDFEFLIEGLQGCKGIECKIAYDDSNILMCPRCRDAAPNTVWIDTYNHPERVFEYGDICECCGSEVETIQDIKTGNIAHKCVNENCVRH